MSEAAEVAPVSVTWADVRVTRRVAPRWPEGRDRSTDAACSMTVVFDPDGVPLLATALGCDADLAEAAVDALMRWRFAYAPGLIPAERSSLEMRLRFPVDSVREGEIGGGVEVSGAGAWAFAGRGYTSPYTFTGELGVWGSGGEGGLQFGSWHDGGQVGIVARAPLGPAMVAFSPGLGSSLRFGPAGVAFGFEAAAGVLFNPFERGPTVGIEATGSGWIGFRIDPESGTNPTGTDLALRVRVGWRFRDRASGE